MDNRPASPAKQAGKLVMLRPDGDHGEAVMSLRSNWQRAQAKVEKVVPKGFYGWADLGPVLDRMDEAELCQTLRAPDRRPRFGPATLGFWLGGGLLGTGGCLLGLRMPYDHPVAVVISVVWWGIYLGCCGGGVGALIALLLERAPDSASRGVAGRS